VAVVRAAAPLHASAMSICGPGPFDNDAATNFLDTLRACPIRFLAKTLRDIAGTGAGNLPTAAVSGQKCVGCAAASLTMTSPVLDLAFRIFCARRGTQMLTFDIRDVYI